MLRRLIDGGTLAVLATLIGVTLPGQGRVPAGDWRTYNRTVAGDRFSPLAEITPANVSQLREICRYALPEVTSLQTGPHRAGQPLAGAREVGTHGTRHLRPGDGWDQRHADA